MTLPRRRLQLEKELDQAIREHDMVAIRMIGMELRDLEAELEKKMDIAVAQCFMAARCLTKVQLN